MDGRPRRRERGLDGAYTDDELLSLAATELEGGDAPSAAVPRLDRAGETARIGASGTATAPLRDEARRTSAMAPSLLEGELLDLLPFAVVALTGDLVVAAANAEAERALGLPGRGVGAVLPEPWAEFSLRRFAGAVCAPGALPSEVRAHVDRGRVLELTALPRSGGAVLVVRDVTGRARRDEAERTFVTNAAHELRASLGGISSAVEALELGAKDDPRARDRFVGALAQEIRRLRDDVEGLLVLARAHADPAAVALEPVEVAPLLQQVAETISFQTGVEVGTACEPIAAVRGTRPLLEVALSNVARNAATHSRCGEITVSCRRSAGDRVAVEVSDDGPGIAPAVRERLFERFSEGGTGCEGFGIGLPLTREIVLLFGGDVELESDETGTTVRLLLRSA
jgi:signal transduction histidine kinase